MTLKLFTTNEIIQYPFPEKAELLCTPPAREGGEELVAHWEEMMHTRVVQHNIRVASAYYKRITGKRLSELLGLSGEELEKHLSVMVSNGDIFAKIDRPNDIVRFERTKTPEDVLTDWSADINSLLNLVETTTHSIAKEMMA